jgi:hypothetical protein
MSTLQPNSLPSRGILMEPASNIFDFILRGYATTGFGIGTLLSLSTIYPTPSLLRLANLHTKVSDRSQRADARASPRPSVDSDNPLALHVVLFKKLANQNIPSELGSDAFLKFFTAQFSFGNSTKALEEFQQTTSRLIAHPSYHILAITALVYSPDTNRMIHAIIGAALYMHDQNNGTFVFTIGVHDRGDPNLCSLNDNFFTDPAVANDAATAPILFPDAGFRQKGLATFMLSLIQVCGYMGYANYPPEIPEGPYTIPFHV